VERGGYCAEAFDSAAAFLQQFQPERTGCLLLDVQMPGMSGLELQQLLNDRNRTLPVIIMTGFLLFERLNQAIAIDQQRRESMRRLAEIELRMGRLTPREREVMHLVISGNANREIAQLLQRSEKTIEIHRAHVMKKMEAQSLADLVRLVEDHYRLGESL
jgi:FixJ family two-component response regulator